MEFPSKQSITNYFTGYLRPITTFFYGDGPSKQNQVSSLQEDTIQKTQTVAQEREVNWNEINPMILGREWVRSYRSLDLPQTDYQAPKDLQELMRMSKDTAQEMRELAGTIHALFAEKKESVAADVEAPEAVEKSCDIALDEGFPVDSLSDNEDAMEESVATDSETPKTVEKACDTEVNEGFPVDSLSENEDDMEESVATDSETPKTVEKACDTEVNEGFPVDSLSENEDEVDKSTQCHVEAAKQHTNTTQTPSEEFQELIQRHFNCVEQACQLFDQAKLPRRVKNMRPRITSIQGFKAKIQNPPHLRSISRVKKNHSNQVEVIIHRKGNRTTDARRIAVTIYNEKVSDLSLKN